MFSRSVCVGGARRSGGNKVRGGQGRAANCLREMTVDSLIVKVNIFPNPNLTFRTNLTLPRLHGTRRSPLLRNFYSSTF